MSERVSFAIRDRQSPPPSFYEGWGVAAMTERVHYFLPAGYVGNGNYGVQWRSLCGGVWTTKVQTSWNGDVPVCKNCERSV